MCCSGPTPIGTGFPAPTAAKRTARSPRATNGCASSEHPAPPPLLASYVRQSQARGLAPQGYSPWTPRGTRGWLITHAPPALAAEVWAPQRNVSPEGSLMGPWEELVRTLEV